MPTQLVLTESSGGNVSGTLAVTFPGGSGFFQVDTVTGSRSGESIPLTGATGITLNLTRSGKTLSGPITFSFGDNVIKDTSDAGGSAPGDAGSNGSDAGASLDGGTPIPPDAGLRAPAAAQVTVTR
jgi:hypothetical protein